MQTLPIAHREGTEAHYRDAAYYDRRYRQRRVDVHYYADLAERIHAPVLELGVGTGRVAFEIARRGIPIVGVDRMNPMLSRAMERLATQTPTCREHLELIQGDIRNLNLRRRFGLVIAPFNVFMHLYTRTDVERTLATVRKHLKRGGLFAFDVLNPDPRAMARNPTRLYRCRPVQHPQKEQLYKYSEAFHYDGPTQVMHMSLVLEHPNDPSDVQITGLSHRQFFPMELEALLHYNGFDMEAMHGGFAGEPLTSHSESLVVTARVHSAGHRPKRVR